MFHIAATGHFNKNRLTRRTDVDRVKAFAVSYTAAQPLTFDAVCEGVNVDRTIDNGTIDGIAANHCAGTRLGHIAGTPTGRQ